MRLLAAIKNDLLSQMKNGFYLIYIVITLIYLMIMAYLPKEYLKYVLPVLIFSDPSALGLFFIGGVIMLEKMQGIVYFLLITPLTAREYILSKTISLSILSAFIGLLLALLSKYKGPVNYFYLIMGIILTAIFFNFIGIIIASKCLTLNQYFVKMVPLITVLLLPCMSLIGFKYANFFTLIPSVAALRIVFAAYHQVSMIEVTLLMGYVSLIDFLILKKVEKVFEYNVLQGG